ncbi:hypothetical protein LV84_00337 [Algoriphagus ratkowskyi]|uniref:Uncharacterized protein n=1 Tax=Algoriphagus ratkowskyi TaxID=57028 RepID=A0A2W7S317_9BACT|nr:hypothetical protein [Algoriphagus ratkowskyi]PZX61349.1 hypothetical protein LV84_00337 [Algoriphagus ratkowskyi]TXD79446.1 hypothetical protein ESW18_04260 [Algoriphagus ratkowskyi]
MDNFKELTSSEIKFIDGGGWIADAVEWFVSGLICGCTNDAREGARGYGGVLGMNDYVPNSAK